MAKTGQALKDHRWSAFAVCTSVAILTILDIAKVNVTLGPIEHTLGASTSQLQLIVAGYVLAFGIFLVPAGRLGDLKNRKVLFLVGLSLFIVASSLCAFAPTSDALVIGRILQGISAGILMPQVIGLIQQMFQGEQRGRALGIFGAAIGFGTAFGPTLGGVFIGAFGEEGGWRWTFGMNIPLAIILLVFAAKLIPSGQVRRTDQTLDIPGVLLLASIVLCAMLPFVLTTGTAEDDPNRWFFLLAAAVLIVVFVWWERRYLARGKSPLIDFALFRTPSYRYGVIITTLVMTMMPTYFLLQTMYLQEGLGHFAVVVGAVTVPYALTSGAVAAFTGKYTHKHGALLVLLGTALFLGGYVLAYLVMLVSPIDSMPIWLALVLMVTGVGGGLVMSANQMRLLSRVPVAEGGVAGSFAQVGQRLGSAIGIAAGSAIFFGAVAHVGALEPNVPREPWVVEAYNQAIFLGMLLVIGIALVSFIVSLIDYRASKHESDHVPGALAKPA